jgi:hypothetical protein
MTDDESPLHGGNISQVVRVGTTVRRHQGPWRVAVHGLLQHLQVQGFDGAPRFLGIDDQDREILSFIPGEVGNYPLQPSMWSDVALIGAGWLLRRLHDATVGYDPPDAPWQQISPDPSLHEVICHNDVAPYNTVFVDGEPRAFIDFDTAGPGPRIWDVAYAAYTFVPLAQFVPLADGTTIPYEPTRHAENRRRRLRLLSDSYGLERAGDLMLVVERRLQAMCETLVDRAAQGDAVYQHLIDEGHLAHYQAEVAFVRQHGSEWTIGADG